MSIETYQHNGPGDGVARYQAASQTPELARPRTVQRLTEWAESARAAYEVAEKLVRTSFVPAQFRDLPHEATAAILAGDEVGLSPMASLRAFDIIQGSAAPRAITHRAVVQSQGHSIWVVECTATRAIVRGQRAGESEIQESEWTIDRARQFGLTNKENYRKQPKAMLLARATSECSRLVAADALMGMPYSVEELTDGALPDLDAPGQGQAEPPATPAQPGRRTAQRRTAQPRNGAASTTPPAEPPASEEPFGPPLPGEDGYDEPTATEPAERQPNTGQEPGSITRAQSTKLHAIFGAGEITRRNTKLAISSQLVGRDLASSADLSKAEATVLIDNLERLAAESAERKVTLAEDVAELLDGPSGDATDGGEPS